MFGAVGSLISVDLLSLFIVDNEWQQVLNLNEMFFLLQIGFKNQEGVEHVPLSQEKAVNLVKDVFISAAERDIYTGDAIVLRVITKDGVTTEEFPLRRD